MIARRTKIVVIFIVGLIAIFLYLMVGFVGYRKTLSRYHNVRISDDRNEVGYRLGPPPLVVGPASRDAEHPSLVYYTDPTTDPSRAMPAGKTANDFPDWNYPVDSTVPNGPYVSVHFGDNNRVEFVRCIDVPPMKSATCDALAGINIASTEEEVVAKLGTAPQSRIDGAIKVITYPNLGLQIYLTKGKVYGLALQNQNNGELMMFVSYASRLFWQ